MILKGKISFIAACILICSSAVSAAQKIPVFVSILPQKYFVQQIGGDYVDVHVMVESGATPHQYEPKPKQMAALSKTQVYFAVGVGFETVWLHKISATNPEMRVIHTDHGISKIPMAARHHHENQAPRETAAQGDHPGKPIGLDPHIWLSPPLVKVQVHAVLTALQDIDPAHSRHYESNYRQFLAAIDKLDAGLKRTFDGRQGLEFMVFHPSWGYFAGAYGLKQVPIEIEGKSPKPAQLVRLIEHAREKGIKVIFVQPQFSAKSAALVAGEIGGQVVFADPLAAEWSSNLREVGRRFAAALQ